MKSLTKRISIIILTICLVFINIFSSYKVAFASPVPDPMAIEETFRLIEGGLKSINYPVGVDTWSLGDLVSVGIAPEYSQQIKGSDSFLSELFSVNNGTQNIAWEKLKNVAVVEPAKLVKYIMWDKPQEYLPTNDDVKNALKEIADKTGAAVTLVGSKIYNDTNEEINATAEALAESYLYVNDGFIEPLKEAASSHVKGNKYYQNISDIPVYEYTGGDTVGNYFLFDIKAKSIDPYGRESYNFDYHYYRDTVLRGKLDNYRLCWRIYPDQWDDDHAAFFLQVYDANGKYKSDNMAYYKEEYSGVNGHTKVEDARTSWSFSFLNGVMPVFSTNIPIFYDDTSMNNFLKTGVANGAVNAPTYEKEKIVVPIQYPQTFPGVVNANPYAFQNYVSYVQQMKDALTQVINNLKTDTNGQIVEMPYTTSNPLELPFQYPDGSPVNSPSISPITTPISIPETVPPIEILPTPTDDEGDNPSGDDNNNKNNNDDDFDLDDDNGDPLLDLSNFFPFCLPHDFMTAIKLLAIEGEPPVFEIPLKYNVLGNPVEHTVVIDIMKPGTTKDNSNAIAYVKYIRWFQTIAFIIAMIFITIKITPH